MTSPKIIFYLLLSFLSFTHLQGQTLHLVLVSLTNDPSIGTYCQINHQSLLSTFKQVAQLADMPIKLVELQGEKVNSTSINRQLDYLSVAANDVVIFHYSGHGLNGAENFPRFLISGNKLTLAAVHEKLRKKGGRLTLTISDCCNFSLDSKSSTKWGTKSNMIKENCVKLLKQGRGNIIATSSEKGEGSNYIENIGGLYTSSFVDALLEASKTTKKENVDWKKIFEETNKATIELSGVYNKIQTPLFQINPPTFAVEEESEPTPQPIPNNTENTNNEIATVASYKIISGDTYGSIAKKLLKGESKNAKKVAELTKKLQEWNPTKKATKLQVGDILVVLDF